MMTKKVSFAFVSIIAIVMLSAVSGSCLFARTIAEEAADEVVKTRGERPPSGVTMYLDGGRASSPAGGGGRFHIRNISALCFRLRADRTDFMPAVSGGSFVADASPVAAARVTNGSDRTEVTPARISGQRFAKTAALSHSVSRDEIKNTKNAGGDVLRSLQTLPSVAVANDFSSQLFLRGARLDWNAVLPDGVPFFITERLSDGAFTVDDESFAAIIENAAADLRANMPRDVFHLDARISYIDREDPKLKPVLPQDYYRKAIPATTIDPLDLAKMSVEESERKHTPYPFTDKGNHMCRDLVAYFSLRNIFRTSLMAAGVTYLLSTGFELIEPQIDGKVRGPNHYDPLYGAAGYSFHIFQEKGLIPHNLWWSIDFYTDDNPVHNAEHKPMRAELHCSLPFSNGDLDLSVFYDNHGYDPTISYPIDIRISSEKNK